MVSKTKDCICIKRGIKQPLSCDFCWGCQNKPIASVCDGCPEWQESPIYKIKFQNNQHKKNFESFQKKVSNCKIDNAYLVASYILALPELYKKNVHIYFSNDGFCWQDLLEKVDLSSGYCCLVRLAINLFTGSLGDFNLGRAVCCLDDDLFEIMLQAIKLSRCRRLDI